MGYLSSRPQYFLQGGGLCFWVRICPRLEADKPDGRREAGAVEKRAQVRVRVGEIRGGGRGRGREVRGREGGLEGGG